TIQTHLDGGTAIILKNGGLLSGFRLESAGKNQNGILVTGIHPVLRNIELHEFQNIGLRLGNAGVVGAYFAEVDNIFVFNKTQQGNIGILVDGQSIPNSNANTFRNVFVKGKFKTFVNLKGNDNSWYAGGIEWDCDERDVEDVWLIEGIGNIVSRTYMESGKGIPSRVFRFAKNANSNMVKDVYATFFVKNISSKLVDEGWGNELKFRPVSHNLPFPAENTGITNLIPNSHFRSWSEKSPVGWIINRGSFFRDSLNIKGAAYSLKAVATSDNPIISCYISGHRTSITSLPIERFQGQTLVAGVWVKTGKAEMGNLKIWADGSGGGGFGNNNHSGNNTWQFLTATLKVPDNATYLMVQLRGFASGTGTGEVYFSDPILIEGIHLPHPTPTFLNDSFAKMSGPFIFNSPITLTSGGTVPSVRDGNIFKTANTYPTVITGFSEGNVGQKISVIFGDSNTSVGFKKTLLKGNRGVDWHPSKGDHMTCAYDGASWYCDVSVNTNQ
ncbi:MAG: hypothetical protein KJO26_05560, partial [Deltaproteobacteria bacterium]|nr:hypothetical protein [Deltaproteobacteria bacterium]